MPQDDTELEGQVTGGMVIGHSVAKEPTLNYSQAVVWHLALLYDRRGPDGKPCTQLKLGRWMKNCLP